jgi:hypothetical protein
MDTKGLNEAFALVCEGGHAVVVLSQPRTGSKYLHGILTAAYGAQSGRWASFHQGFAASLYRQPYTVNPGHAHGLSDARLEAILAHPPADQAALNEAFKKAQAIAAIRANLRAADRAVVFTVARPQIDRHRSAFALQKHGKVDPADPALLRYWNEFRDRAIAEDAVWWRDNIEPLDPARTLHVTVELAGLDAAISRHLFPLVSSDVLAQRAARMGLKYGLHNRNRLEDRGTVALREALHNPALSPS